MATGKLKTGDSPDMMFDSTKNAFTGASKTHGIPRYYFPLIVGIIIIEAVILVLALMDIVPLHPMEIYPTAAYFNLISANDLGQIGVIITRWFFFVLTAGVMVPVTIIIILEVIRRIINSRRPESYTPDEEFSLLEKLDKAPKNPNLTRDRVEGDYVKRFDVHQRIQHYLLLISFIVLAVTGVLRGFPNWPTFAWFTSVFGGPDVLRIVHDAAAFVMVIDCVYHIFYIAHGIMFKRKLPMAMVPSLKDLKDLIHTFLWIFGMYKHETDFEHFQYGQKIDYWAIFWGMPVMVLTGFIMMFTQYFSQFLSGWAFAVVATAHRDEAILATSFIIIVHMYYGHLSTPAFPVNTVMFTGKMLKSKYREWFGREYTQLTGERSDKE